MNINNDKYFHEAGNGHYDARYFQGIVGSKEIRSILVGLLESYRRMCSVIGVAPILMHGALIGWHWNRRLLPWDDDVDLSMLHQDLEALEKAGEKAWDYDRSSFHFEINPNHRVRSTRNQSFKDSLEQNKIDARFIHTRTGIFIDITALALLPDGRLGTKCPHAYQVDQLFPLSQSEIEGVAISVPHKVEEVLSQEYGIGAVANPNYGSWRFSHKEKTWLHRLLLEPKVPKDSPSHHPLLSRRPNRQSQPLGSKMP